MLEAAKVDMAEFTSTREVAVEAARKSNMDAQQVCRSPPPFTTPLTVLYKSIASLEKFTHLLQPCAEELAVSGRSAG